MPCVSEEIRFRKGYRFRFPGAPGVSVEEAPLPDRVTLSLVHPTGARLEPKVREGDVVRTGQLIAQGEEHAEVHLLASVTGRVVEVVETRGRWRRVRPGRIVIDRTGDDEWISLAGADADPARWRPDAARRMLVDGGVWPLIRSLPHRGPIAPIDDEPAAVVVKCVAAEPFQPRGHALLSEQTEAFCRALELVQRAAGEFARFHLVITAPEEPLAKRIREATLGKAWLRLHCVPVRYPVENDFVLRRLLIDVDERLADACIWFIDVQTVLAMGRCLAEGRPAVERVVAVAGPAVSRPTHVRVRVGASVRHVLAGRSTDSKARVVRGGLLTGTKVEDLDEPISSTETAINVLPEGGEREFLGFMRPGADRDGYVPLFLSWFWPDRPKDCRTSLRGEVRPCVQCGFCEDVCPMDLAPHILHRLLVADRLEEAESLGLELCAECGLCAYVCPCKIELLSQFREAKRQLAAEKAEA